MTILTITAGAQRLATTPPRPGFATTCWIELRKLADTRLAQIIGLATLGLLVLFTGGAALLRDGSYQSLATMAGVPVGMALSVLAIMTSTAEFANRSALTTFLAEPDRLRVIAAKALAVIIATVVLTLAGFAFAAVATPIGAAWQQRPVDWSLDAKLLAGQLAGQLLLTLQAFALGLLLLNAPAALVIVLTQTMVFTMIATALPASADVLTWINPGDTDVLVSPATTGTDWARLAVSNLIWLVIPLVLGSIRVTRKEVN